MVEAAFGAAGAKSKSRLVTDESKQSFAFNLTFVRSSEFFVNNS